MLPPCLLLLVAALAAPGDARAHEQIDGILPHPDAQILPRSVFAHNNTNSSRTHGGVYKVSDVYDYTNFFDKFNFIESRKDTDDYFNVDPTHGFVLYQNRSEAERLGLVETAGDVSIIKVDSHTVIKDPTGYGRKSVRIESKAAYLHGLFIADFSHLPKQGCGTWPAYWMYGPNWPSSGEIDIYEQWNDYQFNRQTLHTDHNATTGACTFNPISSLGYHAFDMTNSMQTSTCDVFASNFLGCSSSDYEGPFASPAGGTYAMEWTSDYIKTWTWKPGEVPADVVRDAPDPSRWGLPGLSVGGDHCDVDRVFNNNSIVLNLDFCGDTSGSVGDWTASCAEKTRYNICARYVAANPADFQDYWFGIRTIKVYTLH